MHTNNNSQQRLSKVSLVQTQAFLQLAKQTAIRIVPAILADGLMDPTDSMLTAYKNTHIFHAFRTVIIRAKLLQ